MSSFLRLNFYPTERNIVPYLGISQLCSKQRIKGRNYARICNRFTILRFLSFHRATTEQKPALVLLHTKCCWSCMNLKPGVHEQRKSVRFWYPTKKWNIGEFPTQIGRLLTARVHESKSREKDVKKRACKQAESSDSDRWTVSTVEPLFFWPYLCDTFLSVLEVRPFLEVRFLVVLQHFRSVDCKD
jgi:hypothetical protein